MGIYNDYREQLQKEALAQSYEIVKKAYANDPYKTGMLVERLDLIKKAEDSGEFAEKMNPVEKLNYAVQWTETDFNKIAAEEMLKSAEACALSEAKARGLEVSSLEELQKVAELTDDEMRQLGSESLAIVYKSLTAK